MHCKNTKIPAISNYKNISQYLETLQLVHSCCYRYIVFVSTHTQTASTMKAQPLVTPYHPFKAFTLIYTSKNNTLQVYVTDTHILSQKQRSREGHACVLKIIRIHIVLYKRNTVSECLCDIKAHSYCSPRAIPCRTALCTVRVSNFHIELVPKGPGNKLIQLVHQALGKCTFLNHLSFFASISFRVSSFICLN